MCKVCLGWFQPLKRAMKAMGSPNFVPEQIETCTMSYSAVSYLKKLKNQVSENLSTVLVMCTSSLSCHLWTAYLQ